MGWTVASEKSQRVRGRGVLLLETQWESVRGRGVLFLAARVRGRAVLFLVVAPPLHGHPRASRRARCSSSSRGSPPSWRRAERRVPGWLNGNSNGWCARDGRHATVGRGEWVGGRGEGDRWEEGCSVSAPRRSPAACTCRAVACSSPGVWVAGTALDAKQGSQATKGRQTGRARNSCGVGLLLFWQ
eukprot:scaffold6388_cov103-Isochrysis_galbana.AAC.1